LRTRLHVGAAAGKPIAPRSVAAKPAPAQAGTTIIVGTSDTLETLSRRYKCFVRRDPAGQWLQGTPRIVAGPATDHSAQTAAVAAPAVAAPALTAPASKVVAAPAAPAVHVVNRGDTLLSIARRSHVPVAQLAKAKRSRCLGQTQARPESHRARLEDRGGRPAGAAGRRCRRIGGARDQSWPRYRRSAARRAAGPGHDQVEETPAAETPAKANEATGALPTFRWPVRGKVITSYGAKTNGKSNDGINLAVPEGTPVKLPRTAVVAYSGNELKVMAIWFWFGTPTVTSPHMPMRVNCW